MIRKYIRTIPINCDWRRMHRRYPETYHVALVELDSGELALIPITKGHPNGCSRQDVQEHAPQQIHINHITPGAASQDANLRRLQK